MSTPVALRCERVSRTFGTGNAIVAAVDDVSLEVTPGEIVLVMGPSGSGKTTLVAMCGALLRPTSGRVCIGDTDVSAAPERQLSDIRLRQIGFVFQSANLLANLSAIENVRIVLHAAGVPRADAQRRAQQLLDDLGLSERSGAYPHQLSGGERQRVAIARALANDPPLLLADEPTANLDSHIGYQLVHTIELLAKERGKTVVIVTHDQRITDIADRVIHLEDGRIPSEPAVVMTQGTTQARMTQVALAGHVRPGDCVVSDGRYVEVLRVQRAQGRKPARGENLHLVGADEVIKINSLDGIRTLARPT